jgi:hypothetical protein
MNILELFCGSGTFSKIARKEYGYKTFTVDYDPKLKPDLVKDILKLKKKDIPFNPDLIWASPPCQSFSVMSFAHHFTKIGNCYVPKSEQALFHIKLVLKTIDLINLFKPKLFYIENPRGLLRSLDFIKEHRKTITYCKYGKEYQKPTDIWTNDTEWQPIPACSANDPCHVAAPRGPSTGLQNHNRMRDITNFDDRQKRSFVRSKIPENLVREILDRNTKKIQYDLKLL